MAFPWVTGAIIFADGVLAMPLAVASLTPTAKLRAVINLGNPILARASPTGGAPLGVSVDLARHVADRLGVAVEWLVVDTAARAVEAVESEHADIGFFAIDPKRGAAIAFTPPYVLIEGAYLVRDESPITRNDEVDRPGQRVVVGAGSAYDLYLTRELRHARIERAASSQAVLDMFLSSGAEVAAGIKQQLQVGAATRPGLRLLDGHFMLIQQALGLPRSRGPEAAAWLTAVVERLKAEGEVAVALQRHGIEGAAVAPPVTP